MGEDWGRIGDGTGRVVDELGGTGMGDGRELPRLVHGLGGLRDESAGWSMLRKGSRKRISHARSTGAFRRQNGISNPLLCPHKFAAKSSLPVALRAQDLVKS